MDSELNPDDLSLGVANAVLRFIKDNPPLWQQWKAARENNAIDAGNTQNSDIIYMSIILAILCNNFFDLFLYLAARMNPAATASADVGFGTGKKG